MRRLAAGNWKMNGMSDDLEQVTELVAAHPRPDCDMVLCLPATLIGRGAERAAGSALEIGAQDCHVRPNGAHTGDLSAPMLHDAGARYVIVGHSERRADHAETDSLVRAKALAALMENMTPIICVGETRAEREAGRALEVVHAQVQGSVPRGAEYGGVMSDRLVIAYEPVWAIGTGLTPTLAEIAEVHDSLRALLAEHHGPYSVGVRLLYGGSVKPSNAEGIFALKNVNGALVGGASLKAAEFARIVAALAQAQSLAGIGGA